MKSHRQLFACFIFCIMASQVSAQITVSTRSPAQAYSVVRDSFLAPSGVMPGSIQNVTFNGVPGALAVFSGTSNIGFTNGIISKYSTPSISTVSQNGIKMGGKAAKMLIERLESEDEEDEQYSTEVIETELVERESTK